MSQLRSEALLVWTLRACGVAAGAIVLLIIAFLAFESFAALRNVGIERFFSDTSWHPSAGAVSGLYNLTPMLLATLYTTLGAVLLAAPLGFGSAIFCHYYAPPGVAQVYRSFLELLAGIPSVVYGFWGLVVLVPMIARLEPPGASLLAGIIILVLMILPTIALVADASLANVPADYQRGAVALGLSRFAMIRGVILPSAKSGLFAGVILATARALGETMAILMVSGNVVQVPESIFSPIRTLTANIALEMGYAVGVHRSALFVSGLILMSVIVAFVSILLVVRKEHNYA